MDEKIIKLATKVKEELELEVIKDDNRIEWLLLFIKIGITLAIGGVVAYFISPPPLLFIVVYSAVVIGLMFNLYFKQKQNIMNKIRRTL